MEDSLLPVSSVRRFQRLRLSLVVRQHRDWHMSKKFEQEVAESAEGHPISAVSAASCLISGTVRGCEIAGDTCGESFLHATHVVRGLDHGLRGGHGGSGPTIYDQKVEQAAAGNSRWPFGFRTAWKIRCSQFRRCGASSGCA